jgi:hypothetical protein
MKQSIEEMAAEARREYFRKWRAENKDKVRKHNQNYWRKKAMQRLVNQSRGTKKAGV